MEIKVLLIKNFDPIISKMISFALNKNDTSEGYLDLLQRVEKVYQGILAGFDASINSVDPKAALDRLCSNSSLLTLKFFLPANGFTSPSHPMNSIKEEERKDSPEESSPNTEAKEKTERKQKYETDLEKTADELHVLREKKEQLDKKKQNLEEKIALLKRKRGKREIKGRLSTTQHERLKGYFRNRASLIPKIRDLDAQIEELETSERNLRILFESIAD